MPAPEYLIPDLLKAVNEASSKAFALWITFLTVGTYLAIAIGTTTHLQLLLAGPVKLPLLGVDMPLFAFYGFVPPMFVVLHLYVLMQLYLLARLLRRFDRQLHTARMQDREAIRDQLDKFVFTQFLIGAPQNGIVRFFLRAVVWLSFIVGPVLLLLGFQLRFLPNHSIGVAYVHRVTLLLDLVILLLLWPQISRGRAQPAPLLRGWKVFCRVGVAVLISGLLGAFSMLVATVPGEPTDQLRLRQWAQRTLVTARPDLVGKWDGRFFSQSLWLPNERLVEPDRDKLEKLDITLSLAGRDLRQANFRGTDLRKSDFKSTDLSGANLSLANLSNADLRGANMLGVDLFVAYLSGANLSVANLGNADLRGADLRGATLFAANLNGANLGYADLRGAELRSANLSGVNLSDLGDVVTQGQLVGACGTDTKLPPGLTTLKPCPETWPLWPAAR